MTPGAVQFSCEKCHVDLGPVWVPECTAGCGRVGTAVPRGLSKGGKPWGSPEYRPAPRRRPPTFTLPELLDRSRAPDRVPWGYDELRLPVTARVALHGLPGQGKSTVACRCTLGLGQAGVDVLVLAVEEGHEQTLVERFERCATPMALPRMPESIRIADVATPEEALEEIDAWRRRAGKRRVIVVDSLSELGASPGWLQDVASDPDTGMIVVEHLTTGNAPRGGWHVAYGVQVRIVCEKMRANVTKNRWGPCTPFDVLAPFAPCRGSGSGGEIVPFTRTRP